MAYPGVYELDVVGYSHPSLDKNKVAPFPSLDELQAITMRCVTQSSVQQSISSNINATHLPDFINTVKALPKDQMPPACAADLIAVA